jgi:glycosyltransferase involved in cell wall biosynthesis
MVFDTQYQMKLQRGLKALLKALKLFVISGKKVYNMKKEKINLIHSNSLTSNIYFAFWAKLFGIKFIAHSHEIREGFIFKLLHKYIALCSDKIIVVSNAVKKNWIDHGINEKLIEVVYNGVDDDFF